MEWSDFRHVLMPVLDTLSMAWAAIWLITRVAAGNVTEVFSVPEGKQSGNAVRRQDPGCDNDVLALLAPEADLSPQRDRWM